jgi:hypothetical protein
MGFAVAAEIRLTCSYMRAQLVLVPCLVSRAISLAGVSATYCVYRNSYYLSSVCFARTEK